MKEKEEKIKKEKMPKEKKAKKEKVKKDKETSKFVQKIKKKWLINGTKTFILVLLIIAVFIAINVGVQSLDLTPIDLTQEKLYTLTDESKERVKNIDKDVNIYFVGYSDDNSNLSLAKQYKEQTMIGFSKLLPQVALGQKQTTVIAAAIFENKTLKLDEVFIPPQCDDAGNALGAAIHRFGIKVDEPLVYNRITYPIPKNYNKEIQPKDILRAIWKETRVAIPFLICTTQNTIICDKSMERCKVLFIRFSYKREDYSKWVTNSR